jgi:26S proteasome regulatory subunit N11
MEVMGLMLGEFVDEYTVKVVDVFAMPQSGTGVSVEAVDPVFQTKMLDMLKQTGRWVSAAGKRAGVYLDSMLCSSVSRSPEACASN